MTDTGVRAPEGEGMSPNRAAPCVCQSLEPDDRSVYTGGQRDMGYQSLSREESICNGEGVAVETRNGSHQHVYQGFSPLGEGVTNMEKKKTKMNNVVFCCERISSS